MHRPPANRRTRKPPRGSDLDRGRDAFTRKLNGQLGFWSRCGEPQCRRAHTCRGDGEACFNRFWPMFSERDKIWIREGLLARAAGQSVAEACATADAGVARWDAIVARADARLDAGNASRE